MAINRDADWLRQKYEIEKLDCVQIAAIVGRDPKSVWSWLRKFGIKTRPRGSNAAQNLYRNGRPAGFKIPEGQRSSLRAARLRDGHYPKSADGSPYWKGKRGSLHPSWNGGSSPERQAFYASAEWMLSRKAAYANAGGKCQRCSSGERLHVHHVFPFPIIHLRAEVWNLRVLCASCHRFVHSNRNVNREFLPPFGVYRFKDGRKIRMNYRPKIALRLPSWL